MTSVSVIEWTLDYFRENEAACKLILQDEAMIKDVPSLNKYSFDYFKDKQFVHFRGMIQDMYNPEIYFEEYEVKNLISGQSEIRYGKYSDAAQCTDHEEIVFDSDKNKNSERQSYIVISVPGINDWAKEKVTKMEYPFSNMTASQSNKRNHDMNLVENMDCSEPVKKKLITKTANSDEKITENNDPQINPAKIKKIPTKSYLLNFPIPIEDGKACIVKIYEEDSLLKLNQIIDIFGFISFDPLLNNVSNLEQENDDDMELATHNPPASIIPRLHAIKIFEVSRHEIDNSPEIILNAEFIRGELRLVLSQLLFGDELAADYLICHLLSSVYIRKDNLCLGAFPLNITHFPLDKFDNFAKDFYEFIKLFVKKSHCWTITLKSLNELNFTPKKDYECNRLTSGILQLSKNTHLVIDETELTAGHVTSHGRENFKAVSDIIRFQSLNYDFKFYNMPYETDLPVLILSRSKSMFPCPMQVVLNVDEDSEKMYPQVIEATHQFLKDEIRLTRIRQYLEVLKFTDFQFTEDVTKVAQEDFVKMRRSNSQITGDDLHSLMVLARLLSLSYGHKSLQLEYWKKAIEMEDERKRRLSVQAAKTQQI
ncbi:mini-chromosome maintenance complex-binding protein-like isoform X2 [Prorops nasuta]|uniref:mini-chromosome maintenance complex-binding protein-like n=1 Tax=Prorops nasuta TaxID=863751 RepID=UPI0034CEB6BD